MPSFFQSIMTTVSHIISPAKIDASSCDFEKASACSNKWKNDGGNVGYDWGFKAGKDVTLPTFDHTHKDAKS